jgi:hypothetical protein
MDFGFLACSKHIIEMNLLHRLQLGQGHCHRLTGRQTKRVAPEIYHIKALVKVRFSTNKKCTMYVWMSFTMLSTSATVENFF